MSRGNLCCAFDRAVILLLLISGWGCSIEEKVKEEVEQKAAEIENALSERMTGWRSAALSELDERGKVVSAQISKVEGEASAVIGAAEKAKNGLEASVTSGERKAQDAVRLLQTKQAEFEGALADSRKQVEAALSQVANVRRELSTSTSSASEKIEQLQEKIRQTDEIQRSLAVVKDELERRVTWLEALLLVLGAIIMLGLLRALFWPATYVLVRCLGRLRGRRSTNRLSGPAASIGGASETASGNAGCRLTMDTSRDSKIFCYPGLITGLEGDVHWSTPLVGNFMQWMKRGVAFLDAFQGDGRIVLLPPGPVETHCLDVGEGERWEISTSAFLACSGNVPRFRFHPSLMRVVARRGFSRFEFSGRGKLWIRGMPGLVSVKLRPGDWFLVPMANVAAYSDAVVLGYDALPLRHALLGRGVFLARLQNVSEEDTQVFLQGLQGLLGAHTGVGNQQSGVFGYIWDVTQIIAPG